ncbi:MFS transporter [Actinotalea sp. C106]|uniref:MFS transporter n=1 Tax=Actinotalea sp. C106 TaxID=2908644 RepID=UPI0027E1AA6A|nr:MFS transporter [Actinotalea sp. C106]
MELVALGALALGGFGIGTAEFAAMGLLPGIAADLGVSIPAAGHVITAYAVGVVLGAPALTALAARWDRRTLLVALMVTFTIGNLLSALAPTLEWLVVGRFFAGLPHGAFFGVGAVTGTAVVGPARRGMAVATMMVGLTVANVVGVPLSTALGQRVGWQSAFVVVGVLGLATLLALVRWIPKVPSASDASIRREFSALANRRLWTAFAAGSIGFGGMFAVYSYVAPLTTEVTGLAERSVPWVLALFGLGMTVGTLVGGRVVDRSVVLAVRLGFVGTILALLLVATTSATVAGALVSLVGLGVSSQVLGIALQARLMDLAPAAPSIGAALCHSALNAGNAAGAFLGGAVIAAGLGFLAPAWVGLALTVVGLAIVLVSGRLELRASPSGPVDATQRVGATP